MIWLAILILCLATCWFVFRPTKNSSHFKDPTTALFKSQLQELQRETTEGTITKEDAQRTALEIKRRLANALGANQTNTTSPINMRTLLTGGTVLMLGCALALYVQLGRPDLTVPPAIIANQGKLPEVEDMIVKLEQRLQQFPDEVEGWRLLGWANSRLSRFERAATAYEEALKREPESVEVMALLGEALTLANTGQVTPRAQKLFEDVLLNNATNQIALFYLATADEQSGNFTKALQRFALLAKTGALAASNRDVIKRHIIELGAKTNTDVSSLLEKLADPAEAASNGDAARIDGMIAGLAQKLADNPDNLQGWKMLIRSLAIKQGEKAARDALSQAEKVFSGRATETEDLKAFARELRLN
jgi:cytochrome c-type biogenesis protein CcmH